MLIVIEIYVSPLLLYGLLWTQSALMNMEKNARMDHKYLYSINLLIWTDNRGNNVKKANRNEQIGSEWLIIEKASEPTCLG